MLINELSDIAGVSGNEKAVRDFIRDAVTANNTSIRTDSMGNLIIFKEGVAYPGLPRIMLSAHMDEVGLMITNIEKSGHLRFKKVGGIDDRVLVAKEVAVGSQKIPGIIGAKAIHLQRPEERKKPFELAGLMIDIGARDGRQAAKLVRVGDYASFTTRCAPVGDGCLLGKAFDDRAGCAALIELLNTDGLPSFYGAFTVQEEVGLRGARVAAYTIEPELALVIETTSAGDTPDKKDHRESTSIGAGPAITFMDASLIVDRELIKRLIKCAETNDIPYQMRRFTGAGTDAGAIAASRGAVRAATISVPARYIHSPASLIKLSDYEHTKTLARLFLESF